MFLEENYICPQECMLLVGNDSDLDDNDEIKVVKRGTAEVSFHRCYIMICIILHSQLSKITPKSLKLAKISLQLLFRIY